MKTLIATVVINNYVREVELSKARKAQHYTFNDLNDLPLKYCDMVVWKKDKKKVLNTNKVVWAKYGKDKHHFLYELGTTTKVIANTKTAGKPRTKIINGQDLHRLTLETYHASKIKRAIKDQFIIEVEKLEPIKEIPLIIEAEIRDTYIDLVNENSYSWDVDNRFLFYGKVFSDVLSGTPDIQEIADGGTIIKKLVKTSKEIIKDDHRGYITGGGHIFTPIGENDTRQLIFRIYHDQREEVKNFIYLVNDRDYQEIEELVIGPVIKQTNQNLELLLI